MRNVVWLAAVAAIGSSTLLSDTASAQVRFGIGPEGPSVSVGRDDDRWDRRRDRRYIERRVVRRNFVDDDRLVTGSTRRCRVVTIREEDDDGFGTVTRRIRRCN